MLQWPISIHINVVCPQRHPDFSPENERCPSVNLCFFAQPGKRILASQARYLFIIIDKWEMRMTQTAFSKA